MKLTIITLLLLCLLCTLSNNAAASESEGSSVSSSRGLLDLLYHYGNVFVWPHQQRPPTKLQIAMVGLPRTGTGSLIEALNVLGYSTVHADEYLELADLFGGLSSSSDDQPPLLSMDEFATQVGERGFNAMYFWSKDFIGWAAHQKNDDNHNVKVILTVRDTPEKWAASFESAGSSWDDIWFSRPFIWWKPVAQMAPTLKPMLQEFANASSINDGGNNSLEQYYLNHIQRIQEVVPADRLLVFNAKQGWEPLCQFLDQPVPEPEIPFPHANERWLLQLENRILWTITWMWPIFPALFMYAIWRLVPLFVVVLLFKKKIN